MHYYWNWWTANSEICTPSYCGTRHYQLTLGHMALFVKSKRWTQMSFPFLSQCWVHCLCIRVMQLKELSLIGFLGAFHSFQLTDNAVFWLSLWKAHECDLLSSSFGWQSHVTEAVNFWHQNQQYCHSDLWIVVYLFWYCVEPSVQSKLLFKGCALRKTKRSQVLWTCEIQGAQLHITMISMRKLRFSGTWHRSKS